MQVIVFFVNEEKLGAQKMLEYIGRMKEDQIYRSVLILQKKLSGPANSERMLVKNSYRIEDVRLLPFLNQLQWIMCAVLEAVLHAPCRCMTCSCSCETDRERATFRMLCSS